MSRTMILLALCALLAHANTNPIICPIGQYLDFHDNCIDCTVDYCIECAADDNCVLCTSDTYWNENTNTCAHCNKLDYECVQCTTHGECVLCSADHFVDYSGKCTRCSEFDYHCVECSSEGYCTSCKDKHEVDHYSGKCVPECPYGLFYDTYKKQCIQCYYGEFRYGDSCAPCSAHVANCIDCDHKDGTCTACRHDAFMSYDHYGGITCPLCSDALPHCQTCSYDGSKCHGCKYGFILGHYGCEPKHHSY